MGFTKLKRITSIELQLIQILLQLLYFAAAQVPIFNPDSVVLEFSEGAVIGTKKLLDTAKTNDGSDIISYGILNENSGSFRLQETRSLTHPHKINYLYLETTKKLDREKVSSYHFNISGESNLGRRGFLDLRVNLLDINDNPPVFEKNEYSLSVNESIGNGVELISVRAVDADSDKNGYVSYSLSKEFGTHFSLDRDTGLIKTKSGLSCSSKKCDLPCLETKICNILVYAKDSGTPQQSSQTVVKIRLVHPANDHTPKISFRYLPDQTLPYATLDARASANTSVAAITVTDQDQGRHGETMVEFLKGNERHFFTLESYGGSLYVVRVSEGAKLLESPSKIYNLTVKASDKGDPPKYSLRNLIIKINEINDYEPVFSSSEYKASIQENAPFGSSVIILSATDKDSKIVQYSFSEDNDSFFIHPKSGLVTTKRKIDREAKSRFNLQVLARDGGVAYKETSATLDISITDVNDQIPTFKLEKFIANVSENVPFGTSVLQVIALDGDQGSNGTIRYKLKGTQDFSINHESGEILTKTNMDAEQSKEYKFTVIAQDQGSIHSLSSTASVIVHVLNMNDNDPLFYPWEYIFDLGEDVELQLMANDPDKDSNLTFSWEGNAPTGFELNASNGIVRKKSSNNNIRLPSSNSFYVTVTDSDGRKSLKTARIRFKGERSDASKIVLQTTYEFELLEDSTIDRINIRELGKVGAKVPGAKFSIIDGDANSFFSIKDKTGVISTTKKIDREMIDFFHLKILVEKGEDSFGFIFANITILDVNDNAPQILEDLPIVTKVERHSPVGHYIHRINAQDKDIGDNGKLFFELRSGSYDGLFIIQPHSGILSLNKTLDNYVKEFKDIKVSITDLGNPRNEISVDITVQVLDTNDHAPIFDFHHYEISVSESTFVNTRIISLTALDLDPYDKITYSIVDGNDDKFGIFPDGELYLKDSLDREDVAYYSVTVEASDNGIGARSSSATVVIYVTDENDNAPIFEKKNYVYYLHENENDETVVGRVTASDRDIDRNAELEYMFVTTSPEYFHIDSVSGFISSNKRIDREALIKETGQDFFQFDVQVRDNGITRLFDKTSVSVIIIDRNDNAPKFSEKIYEVQVSENAKIGSEIISVHAEDIDKNENGFVIYSIIDNDRELFEIDSKSGTIRLTSILDREKRDKHILKILGTDMGNPSLSSTTTVYIQVKDENDNFPIFAQRNMTISLSESTKIGEEVYRFKAHDADSGDNARIRYSLSGGNHRNVFHLDTYSGVLTLSGELDYESRKEYRLTIGASDMGIPSHNGASSVIVQVLDANDNAPSFPSSAILIPVKEGIAIGSQIHKIDAIDPDSRDNGKFTFAFVPPSSIFQINQFTGVITTKEELDREYKETYTLTVAATDLGKPSHTSKKVITVKLDDINDNAPKITSLNTALILPETRQGSLITQVRAEDKDAALNGLITYELQEKNDYLTLERHTGKLILAQVFPEFMKDTLLTVVARDEAVRSSRKSSTGTIVVIVGRNSPGPNFEQDIYIASIKENSPTGTPIGTVALSSGSNDKIEYYVVGSESQKGKERDLITVDKTSGQVRTTRKLDREAEGDTINISIVAIIGQDLMSRCKMIVTLLDENDSPPEFDESTDIIISEDFCRHDLGFIRAIDPDKDSHITYELDKSTQDYLSINQLTGRLTLTKSVDREKKSSLEVLVTASDGKHTSEWKKNIQVLDVNDNPPVFVSTHFSFDILETSERGTIIGRIEAHDSDEGKNGNLVYRLISEWGSSTFTLDPTSGVLSLSGQLDHEEIQHYILEVSASDGGDPILTTTVTVYVNVKDVNDNPPEIEKVLYEVNIKEDSAIGSPVVQIMASDRDSRKNTDIVFSLDDSVQDTFKVYSNGTITTKTLLDREKVSFYTFTVRVKDSPDFGLTATTVVQITVVDVNDEPPIFNNRANDGVIPGYVFENSPPNTPIITLETEDKDEGKNSEIRYYLDDSHLGKFSVGRIDGVLRTGIPLDREEKEYYMLSVTAVDGGIPSLSSKVDILIHVKDINDNGPVINPKHYSASVMENASIGMEIVSTSATDKDSEMFGRLRYSIISGDSSGDFAIGEYSGILRVNKKLDYERKNSYELTIQAEDGGDSGGSTKYDTASVTIVILDTNDNAPLFMHSPYMARIIENAINTHDPIFKIEAKDKDDPPFNSIEYNLRNTHNDLFSINSLSGEIFVQRNVDREENDPIMILEVIAMDSGSPRLTGTGTLSVVIDDVNDNPPEFENSIYHFYTPENEAIGSTVAQVLAFDLDIGLNAKIVYSIEDSSQTFSINPNEGTITTNIVLDREKVSEYYFRVTATDSSPFISLSSQAEVKVFVEDINDNKPVIHIGNTTDFFIPPTLQPGNFVLGIFATDEDKGDNGKLSYRIVGKDGKYFSIDRNNGVVTASNNFKPKFSYELTIVASDNGPPLNRLTSSQKMFVYLAEDLSVPVFNQYDETSLDIPEDTPIGSVIWSAAASPTKGEVESVHYGVAGGNVGFVFSINASTGDLFIQSALDYESVKSYKLWIKSFYETRPLFFNAYQVQIKILDTNDNAPKFEKILNKISIPEGIFPPFDVTEINAIDRDTGLNGDVSYSLLDSSNNSLFTIDSYSGTIRCTRELDREENDRYAIQVIASDKGTPALSSTATILLTVEDVNDNAPKFSRLYSVNLTENIRPGTVILTVETDDKDSPPNSNVSYSFISNPDNIFKIDPFSGEISVIGHIDRELQDEFALRVQATDGAWKLETIVTVTIQDENDNVPIFDQDVYNFIYPQRLNETKIKDSFVGKVNALDRDASGGNSVLSYSLAHVSDYFKIESGSGKISTKKLLNYKGSNDGYVADNSYKIRVLATDAGTPPMSSECQVVITLIDGNNHAPKFKSSRKEAIAIPSNIPDNSVVYRLEATDKDSTSRLNFQIVNKNPLFSLDSSTGEIKVHSGNLIIGTEFNLHVSVDDGRDIKDFQDLQFIITGDNLFSPEFLSPATRIYIREDEAVGNTIVTLTADDEDEGINGVIEYEIIKGDLEGTFSINPSNGKITVKKSLDYEKVPVYNILVRAKDMGFNSKSATASVKIILHDVDDNQIYFDKDHYEAFLMENSDPGTVVTQIIAIDQDSPKHSQIQYSISSANLNFRIDPDSGIVQSKTTFDFEEIPFEEFEVSANSSNYIARTTLRVNIKGENEFYPKFKQPVFQFAISETSHLGSSIGQVEADDYDAGEDGIVYYYFVGASNAAGFQIDPESGIISVQKKLDRESQNRYVLTVLAKNHGSILGNDTDEAQIIIQVQDGNDPPVFSMELYSAEVSEDASLGTRVLSVSAVDKDVRPRNSHFSYSLTSSSPFSIGSSSGVISVAGKLDRETSSLYNLTVQAVDNGSPPATGTTVVRVFISDVNDSPPVLDERIGHIKENSPPNSFVMQLSASDPDLPPNSGPFRFILRENPYITLESNSGIIRTKSAMDREKIPSITAFIEVEDSGRPPLSAEYQVEIQISDENDNPSSPRNLDIIVTSYEGTFPGGIIAPIQPSDPDIVGNYQCKLLRGPDKIFYLNENCNVSAGRIQNGREYELTVEVNDGRHPDVKVHANLIFQSFSLSAVQESVVVRFYNRSSSDVLDFFNGIKRGKSHNLELISISKSVGDEEFDAFIISKSGDEVHGHHQTKSYLQSIGQFDGISLNFDPCSNNPCLHFGQCSSRKIFVNHSTSIVESSDTIFNSPLLLQDVRCICTPEYAGSRCQIQKNPCNPNPCLEGGNCVVRSESSFQCLCPPLRGGDLCETTQTDVCSPNPCFNGGSCQKGSRDSFFCRCRPGYQGDRCERAVDSCLRNPCLNGGVCISQKPDYRCRCPDNFYGNRCELSTFGFDELSFAAFPPLDSNTNDISITFATTKANSLLVYNHGEVSGGRSDFLALELVRGRPKFSWGAARTAVTILELPRKINNGRWYKVTATRNNRVASLSIEDCTESAEYCKLCQQDDSRCFSKDLGEAGTLVFGNNPMYLGGLQSEIPFLERPGQLSSDDFVGCIKTLTINGNEKDFQKDALNTSRISSTCNFDNPCHKGNECGETGTCLPLWSRHQCSCGTEEIKSIDCDASFAPFTLMEENQIDFIPTQKFRRSRSLHSLYSHLNKWNDEPSLQNHEEYTLSALSLTFRSLQDNAVLLTSKDITGISKILIINGILVYQSSGVGLPEINMTSGHQVNDGLWHSLKLDSNDKVLNLFLDNAKVGYDIEFASAHKFLDRNIEKISLGFKDSDKGFRGCMTNFTINQELQTPFPTSAQEKLLFKVQSPLSKTLSNGCDLNVLESTRESQAIDIGVALVIAFFCDIIYLFRLLLFGIPHQKMVEKNSIIGNKPRSQVSAGAEFNSGENHQQLPPSTVRGSGVGGNDHEVASDVMMLKSVGNKPDIIEADDIILHPRSTHIHDPNPSSFYDRIPEHYDLDNASSIAPSDIDVAYHYKAYRSGRKSSLPFKKKRGFPSNITNTPLARLSPSSEISHNTPRILTLGDLSGKSLPPGLVDRGLSSPLSNMSRSSGKRTLTSENVARFNGAKNSSTLVNTMDMVVGSEDPRKKTNKTPTSTNVRSSSSSSSEDGDNDDDSFTCSEYDYDEINHPSANKDTRPLVTGGTNSTLAFSKLMGLEPENNGYFRDASDEDDDEDEHFPRSRPSSRGVRSWESLLSWTPDYESFSGVFRDIAELPHNHCSLLIDGDCDRPNPLGERAGNNTEEEYI
ncbi:LOW QUALITY PROTEIN: cadherin-related tumor suppressor-like [Lepeophtheirus salmonis]|uniref:LOW QUALITY PROTEIN: cadherin-related tumor suppressor-like n=1 Tax=Lepeophtheirus salmonis TaxID=72036 RepID=UPI003AF3B5EE